MKQFNRWLRMASFTLLCLPCTTSKWPFLCKSHYTLLVSLFSLSQTLKFTKNLALFNLSLSTLFWCERLSLVLRYQRATTWTRKLFAIWLSRSGSSVSSKSRSTGSLWASLMGSLSTVPKRQAQPLKKVHCPKKSQLILNSSTLQLRPCQTLTAKLLNLMKRHKFMASKKTTFIFNPGLNLWSKPILNQK